MTTPQWTKPMTVEEMYGYWDYEAAVALLERSLDPRPAQSIFDTVAALGAGTDDVVLDIGGRDGRHGLVMAERFGCRVVSVDPAPANIADGERNVAEHEYGHLVSIRQGSIEQIPGADAEFDLVFSRDMLAHVADLGQGLAECHRVLKPGGAMLIHQVFATDLLEPKEAERLYADLAVVPERMSVADFEAAVGPAGFSVESLDVIGSEWYEASQEAGTAPNYALQLSRLRRAKDDLLARLGEMPYRTMYGNALWSIYLLIGKLETRLYSLRRDAT
jgi:cyclopropane fatty-acyl-phospholipid synthase-like methyltransferase